jgi:hypothetical protein
VRFATATAIAKIEQHHVGFESPDQLQGLFADQAAGDIEIGKYRGDLAADGGIILKDQQLAALAQFAVPPAMADAESLQIRCKAYRHCR